MVQAMLADRFKLVIHRESREMPVYALVVAKGGPKLQKADIEEKDCPDPLGTPAPDPATLCHNFMGSRGSGGLRARAISMSDLASASGGLGDYTGRPVVDKTGLQGLYQLKTGPWQPVQLVSPAPGAKDENGLYFADEDTIFEVFEKLGLKLEPQNGNVDVYVIDGIERPTPN